MIFFCKNKGSGWDTMKKYNFMRQNIICTKIMITIYKASKADAAMLTQLARSIYRQHYLHLWHAGGADWYMNEYAYAAHKIEQELADPLVDYFIAAGDDQPLGYMKLNIEAALGENPDALEVERIYLHKSAAGKGIGRQMMELALQRAKELKKDILFLKAMDSSIDAIAFYQKLGYTICGSLQLPMPEFSLMKAEYRGMVIMKGNVQE
jgi:diamine N-acetyltransferase